MPANYFLGHFTFQWQQPICHLKTKPNSSHKTHAWRRGVSWNLSPSADGIDKEIGLVCGVGFFFQDKLSPFVAQHYTLFLQTSSGLFSHSWMEPYSLQCIMGCFYPFSFYALLCACWHTSSCFQVSERDQSIISDEYGYCSLLFLICCLSL